MFELGDKVFFRGTPPRLSKPEEGTGVVVGRTPVNPAWVSVEGDKPLNNCPRASLSNRLYFLESQLTPATAAQLEGPGAEAPAPSMFCVWLPFKTEEQAELIQMFATELDKASGDGGKKRAAGLKPSWKVDTEHEGAVLSHLMKWKRPSKHPVIDPESGTHTLVHGAWRMLAIALQELHPEWKEQRNG